MARVLNPLDYVSGARTIIDFAHHELHDGTSFVTALTLGLELDWYEHATSFVL